MSKQKYENAGFKIGLILLRNSIWMRQDQSNNQHGDNGSKLGKFELHKNKS